MFYVGAGFVKNRPTHVISSRFIYNQHPQTYRQARSSSVNVPCDTNDKIK